MIPEIYDTGDGILLQFPVQDGFLLGVVMSDEAAEEMVDIIKNKLNARC